MIQAWLMRISMMLSTASAAASFDDGLSNSSGTKVALTLSWPNIDWTSQ